MSNEPFKDVSGLAANDRFTWVMNLMTLAISIAVLLVAVGILTSLRSQQSAMTATQPTVTVTQTAVVPTVASTGADQIVWTYSAIVYGPAAPIDNGCGDLDWASAPRYTYSETIAANNVTLTGDGTADLGYVPTGFDSDHPFQTGMCYSYSNQTVTGTDTVTGGTTVYVVRSKG